jgi:hypothetical protein
MNELRRKRYLQDPLSIRLGNLSSSLGRLADSISRPERRDMALRMVDECRWFIEWTAADADAEIAAELARLQLTLTMWRKRYLAEAQLILGPIDAAHEARKSAEMVLGWSGLIANPF